MTHDDEQAVQQLDGLARALGRTPGRNEIMRHLGWGASKSTRILNRYTNEKDSREALAAIERTIAHLEQERDRIVARLAESRGQN